MPATTMTNKIVDIIMIEVLTILVGATEEMKCVWFSELIPYILPFLTDGCSEKTL